jgi:hypothetical protein
MLSALFVGDEVSTEQYRREFPAMPDIGGRNALLKGWAFGRQETV